MNNKIYTFLVMGILINVNVDDAQGSSNTIRDSVAQEHASATAPVSASGSSDALLKEALKQQLITYVKGTGDEISGKAANTLSTFFETLKVEGSYIDMTKKDFMSEIREVLTQAEIGTKNIHKIISDYTKYLKKETTFGKAHNLCMLLFSCMYHCIDGMRTAVDATQRNEIM